MALRSSTQRGFIFRFDTPAVGRNELHVVSVSGREAISRPYRWELDLVSERPDVDAERVLRERAILRIKQPFQMGRGVGIRTVRVHGIVASFQRREAEHGRTALHAVLVPRLWRLSLNHRTRIFLDKSVPEIVESVLRESDFVPEDFTFRTEAREYSKREHVVQYEESDLDFVSRLMEHEGISFAFVQDDERERVVFADSNDGFEPIVGGPDVPYFGAAGPAVDEEAVRGLTEQFNLIPAEVVLRDYNYRTPGVDLRVSAPVDDGGFGVHYEYGDHYKDPDEGATLARIRAEELRGRERLFQGVGDSRSFQAGKTFRLTGHPREDLAMDYLLTEVRHQGKQDLQLAGAAFVATGASYENRFTAIPAAVPFRPPRLTPRPRIPGTMHARVDAAGDGKYAELDEEGRYKVEIPFDLAERPDAQASRPIRMAQPYAGPDYGFHLPLHKGTEVVLTHIAGDPDRPIISAAVPNPETRSPVTAPNQTQSIWKSAGTNAIVFEDMEGEERFFLHAQRNEEIRVRNDALELVARDRHLIVDHDRIERVGNDHHETIGRDHVVQIGGSRHVTLRANDSTDIGGRLSLTVEGDVAHVFMANHSETTTGQHFLKAGQVVIEADRGITLKCGSNAVVVDAAGVTLTGGVLALDGAQTKINSGPGSAPASGHACAAATPRAPAEPGEPGDLQAGSLTVSGAGAEPAAAPAQAGDSWISIELRDDAGHPVPHELYEVALPDGAVIRGRLDDEGRARVEGISPGEAQITFPRRDQGNWSRA